MTWFGDPTNQKASNSKRVDNIRTAEDKALPESLVDTTNLAIATYHYPSATGAAMLPSKDLSFTGKIIDADGTVTVTFEGTNDEDLATADWIDFTPMGTRTDLGTMGHASIAVTNGTLTFGMDFDEVNYDYYRVQVICADSATNTVIIKQRKKAR